jgi:hypothetical protein
MDELFLLNSNWAGRSWELMAFVGFSNWLWSRRTAVSSVLYMLVHLGEVDEEFFLTYKSRFYPIIIILRLVKEERPSSTLGASVPTSRSSLLPLFWGFFGLRAGTFCPTKRLSRMCRLGTMGVGQAQGSSMFWIFTAFGEGRDSGSVPLDWTSGGGGRSDPET